MKLATLIGGSSIRLVHDIRSNWNRLVAHEQPGVRAAELRTILVLGDIVAGVEFISLGTEPEVGTTSICCMTA